MEKLTELSQAGVSIWLDDLSRSRITSGNLQQLIDEASVVGVTTNPAIFQAAIAGAADYAADIAQLESEGAHAEEIITKLTTDDVRAACDLFAGVYADTNGYDGRVSIEVDPRLAHRCEHTFHQAKELWQLVDRPNLMIKIPATKEGLNAIKAATAEGISVNVTLIFSIERYREVTEAYLAGLEKALEKGVDISQIHSVASFFISRVDTEVDKRLEKLGGPDALEMRGEAGIANARAAYGVFIEQFEESERFAELAAQGANVQRPLWASTGVKNPNYSPTLYVDQLVSAHVVNTMPEATLEATAREAEITGDTIRANIDRAHSVIDKIIRLGIDFQEVTTQLENEGVEKFEIAWNELIVAVEEAMK
ncbi:MAG: transaldolase [Trueperella sp.]|nr:transaldolase [Trueperella sp.]